MRTLLSERFAPTTSRIGFLRLDLDTTVEILAGWRRGLGHQVRLDALDGDLPSMLPLVEPLTGGVRPRELLVAATGDWTAYFGCGIQGTDPISTVGYLSLTAQCEGLAITTVPPAVGPAGVLLSASG
jgi:hypothetical protein